MRELFGRGAGLERIIAGLLVTLLVGAIAVAYWGPVRGYAVSCEKASQVSCTLERETSRTVQKWQVPMGDEVSASVQVEPRRRGSARVLLYLHAGTERYFAAEYESASAEADARAAAAALNRLFHSPWPGSIRLEVRPPAYLWWGIWGGIAVLGLFVGILYRELTARQAQRA